MHTCKDIANMYNKKMRYVKIKIPYSTGSHRSMAQAGYQQEKISEWLDSPFSRDDKDWKILYKYNKKRAVALLVSRQKFVVCDMCQNADLVDKLYYKKHYLVLKRTSGYWCAKCRIEKRKSNNKLNKYRPKEHTQALNNLFKKYKAFINRDCKIVDYEKN